MDLSLKNIANAVKNELLSSFIHRSNEAIDETLPLLDDFKAGLKSFQNVMKENDQKAFDKILQPTIEGIDQLSKELENKEFKSTTELWDFIETNSKSTPEGIFALSFLSSFQGMVSVYNKSKDLTEEKTDSNISEGLSMQDRESGEQPKWDSNFSGEDFSTEQDFHRRSSKRSNEEDFSGEGSTKIASNQ